MQMLHVVHLRDIRLPEFDKNRKVDEIKALTFDQPCRYDVILGSDFLTKTGINLLYEEGTMEWFENVIPMRNPYDINLQEYLAVADAIEIQKEESLFGKDWLGCYLTAPILDAKYEKASIPEVVSRLTYLTKEQRIALERVLTKHSKLFDGTLGVYPHKKVHLELEEGAKPVHARAYSIPKIHLETFKRELDHLVELGVLSCQGSSEWASPTFIIPKKYGRVRWISNLHALNKVIKRRQ